LLRDPFPLVRGFNFGPNLRTRISSFALNLEFNRKRGRIGGDGER